MGFKQPRVPEYREGDAVAKHLKALTLFLKDFCLEAWKKSQLSDKEIAGAMKRSGDTMTGAFFAPYVGLRDTSTSRTHLYVNFYKAKVADYIARIQLRIEDGNRRFSFTQAHEDQDNAATVYRQYFRLPLAEAGLKANKYYDVLTTKAAVTIEQGGTGAQSAQGARAALGVSTKEETILAAYPVGSIYMSAKSTSPAALFGGTWEQMKDRFLLGAGESYTAGNTGGAATVTLTTSQIPAHTHTVHSRAVYSGDGNYIGFCNESNGTNTYATSSEGGGASHNNMPPYLVVYMWKRVS